MDTIERWRDIAGTGGKYQVSDQGNVRHIWPSGHISQLKPYKRNLARHNYTKFLLVKMRIDGKYVARRVYKLVADAFLPPKPDGDYVLRHRNGLQSDNYAENLEWIDRRELARMVAGRTQKFRCVEKIDEQGNVLGLYRSAREAGRENYISYQAVLDRINGKLQKPFAMTGYSFRWEDD